MSANLETLDAVIAEMDAPKDGENAYMRLTLQEYAYRLKSAYQREFAAWKKEECELLAAIAEERQKPVGNPVALREALSDACYAMFNFLKTQDGPCYREMTEALDKGKAALASPPRNCDKYTTEKQVEDACEDVRGCSGCFREDLSSPCVSCTVSWLLAPATKKEGGASEDC